MSNCRGHQLPMSPSSAVPAKEASCTNRNIDDGTNDGLDLTQLLGLGSVLTSCLGKGKNRGPAISMPSRATRMKHKCVVCSSARNKCSAGDA